jgi:peptidoglycan DL-endopeptidase CwlO
VAVVGFVLVLIAGALGAGQSEAATTTGCGGGGTAQTIGSVSLTAAQMGNAQTIVTTTAAFRPPLPAYAATVALATSYQESRLTNSTAQTNHDSEGLFQQRVQFYGADVAADPVKATQAFLTRLVKVANWQTIALTDAAADVQNPRTDLRGAYAQWQPLAAGLTSQLWPSARAANPAPTVPTIAPVVAGTTKSAAPLTSSTTIVVPTAACTGDDGAGGLAPAHGHGNNVAGVTHVPAGLIMDGSAAGDAAVTFALAPPGKPYVFDAAGPNSYDCSGLTMAAWATVGVTLEHWTGSQVSAGTPQPLDLSTAVSGDLVLIPGADGTMARPGHVGMIIGYTLTGGVKHLYLVQAPMTGLDVEVTDTSQWNGQIAAVRHIA